VLYTTVKDLYISKSPHRAGETGCFGGTAGRGVGKVEPGSETLECLASGRSL